MGGHPVYFVHTLKKNNFDCCLKIPINVSKGKISNSFTPLQLIRYWRLPWFTIIVATSGHFQGKASQEMSSLGKHCSSIHKIMNFHAQRRTFKIKVGTSLKDVSLFLWATSLLISILLAPGSTFSSRGFTWFSLLQLSSSIFQKNL